MATKKSLTLTGRKGGLASWLADQDDVNAPNKEELYTYVQDAFTQAPFSMLRYIQFLNKYFG